MIGPQVLTIFVSTLLKYYRMAYTDTGPTIRYSARMQNNGGLRGWDIFISVFVAVFLGCTSTGRVDLCFLWFYVQELPKAQPAVVLVLKRLRRRGNGLKSHPTDWEKPGIEPATPGLQDIGFSPTPRLKLTVRSCNL